jgi:hypothetical protein
MLVLQQRAAVGFCVAANAVIAQQHAMMAC